MVFERILILAYDGLEASLVERWRLSGLLQAVHGRYEAAVSPRYGKPHTPSAWTTIITGKPPEEHGVDDWWSYGRILDWLRTHPPLSWVKGKRRIAWRLGIRPRVVNRSVARARTWFEEVKPSIPLFIPAYNEPTWPHEEFNRALERGLEAYIEKVWEIHRWRAETLLETLRGNREWRLLMAWLDIADLLGHACWVKCRAQLYRAYRALEDLAVEARRLAPPGTVTLILSDHGMMDSGDGVTGDHSPHGFWSLSVDIPWFRPRRATDFHPLVLRVLRVEQE